MNDSMTELDHQLVPGLDFHAGEGGSSLVIGLQDVGGGMGRIVFLQCYSDGSMKIIEEDPDSFSAGDAIKRHRK